MESDLAQQIVEHLLPQLEALDTQSAALLLLLKDKGLTTDEEFAPYLEQAGNASNVKWLAARVRLERLLSSIYKVRDENEKKETNKSLPRSGEPQAESDTAKPEQTSVKDVKRAVGPDAGSRDQGEPASDEKPTGKAEESGQRPGSQKNDSNSPKKKN